MCEELGCCATLQKWLIFIVNVILFLVGLIQIIIAVVFLTTDTGDLGFLSEVVEGNNTEINALVALGVVFIFISFWACVGATRHSKCMLWIYAIILFFLILGQGMSIAVAGVSVKYGDSIFGSLWQELDVETIEDIQETYECCSFNGNSNDTWTSDKENFDDCSANNDYDPMQSCWEKFNGKIDDNYNMVVVATSVFLGVQIMIYLSTHYVIQSIAEAEGVAEARGEIETELEMNKPVV